LLTAEEEDIPLFLQLGDGNELDKNAFPEMIKDFKDQWQGEKPEVYVMDAAFYTQENRRSPNSTRACSAVASVAAP
jgi:transposase